MDHYSVLGVNSNATKPQIKEAFKKLAMKFHPDKHTESSKSVQNLAISKFKRVTEAYEVLKDDSKRAEYDSRFGFARGRGGGGGNRGGVGSTSGSASSFYGGRSGDFDAFKERCRNRYRHGSGGGRFDAVLRVMSSPVVLISIAFVSVMVTSIFDSRRERSPKMQGCRKSYEEETMEWPRRANLHQNYRARRSYNQARHYYYNYPPRCDD